EGKLYLACEIGLGRAVLPAAHLARDEEQVARDDRRGVAVLLVEGMPVGGGDCVALVHVRSFVYRADDGSSIGRHESPCGAIHSCARSTNVAARASSRSRPSPPSSSMAASPRRPARWAIILP